MTNPSKDKGDRGEREIAALLADLSGWPVRRRLGAGRLDDTGDLDGLPHTTAQVKNMPRRGLAAAINEGLHDLDTNQANSGTPHGVAFIRRPGGRWIAVLDPARYIALLREATQPDDNTQETP